MSLDDPNSADESPSPEELIDRARAGDLESRDRLLAEHVPALRGFVRLRLGKKLRSREESIDLVQSICGDALTDLGGFDYRGPESFRKWLMQRAENKIRSRGRFWNRAKRAVGMEQGTGDVPLEEIRELAHAFTPSRDAVGREELERLEAAFDELSEDDRRVILLSRVVGLSHAAVAEEMGRTPLATRSLLSRALAKLAARLEVE
jgi:RNA polymerase sigma factor (sigma-70 family)